MTIIFIKKTMGGKMPESTFNRLSLDASAYIKRNTFNRIDINNIPEDVQYCTCSLVDEIKKIEKRSGKASESVGSWSINYQTNSEDSNKLYDILINYLSELKDEKGTPLLYRGC